MVYDPEKDFNYLSYQGLAYGIGKVNSHILKLHEVQLSKQDKRIIQLEEQVKELQLKLCQYGIE
ncbi:MAG: hypothetical protein J6V44_12010 [Methanobrevibacter sp.]|nr:hypothetical protein [Methanobrevibacter sp.]